METRSRMQTLLMVVLAAMLVCPRVCTAKEGPLSVKGTRRFSLSLGYGYSFASNRDVRFASVYPSAGKILTNPMGQGWIRGTVEGILEGAFSLVHKGQHTYSAGVNALVRYNFLPPSKNLRPFVQAGFGMLTTNLVMDDFGSNFNFASNAACGLQYFYTASDALSLEWRLFHISNAGLDDENSGLNMNHFFVGLTHLF